MLKCIPPPRGSTQQINGDEMTDQSNDTPSIEEQIKQTVTDNQVVLFMKGNANFPQCGFSGRAVQILQALETEFVTVDVLSSDVVRQGIKDFSNWPTIPQLYVKGEFVGGCDIMTEMYESGELKDTLSA